MRFLIFFLFILFSIGGITQTTYPSNQWFGSANTLTEFRGAATTVHGFVNAVYADTATANLAPGYLRFYPGAQIMAGDSMYFRNLTATAWLLMNGSGGGGGSQTFQQVLTTGSTLTGNNSIAGGGFNFGITNSHVSLDAPGGNYISLEDGGGDMVFSGQAGEIRLTTTGTANDIHVTVGSATFEIFGRTQSDDIFMRAGKRLELGANASDLSSPVNGQMYYNSVSNKFRAYENGAWTNMIGGGGGTWGSITGTLSNQTDLQNALDLKAPLISPLFTTPRLASTSTTGYVWMATDNLGNGSFQSINLLFDSLGADGISPVTTWNSTLYARRISIVGGTIDTTASGGLVITITGGGMSGLEIGTTTITGGTNTRVLYNNSGVLGEYAITGSGTTIPLSTSPDFTTGITIGGVAVPTISSTNTLTNKRWTARIGSTASSATPTINTDNTDIYKLTALAANITSMTTNLSGTPVDGDILEIQFTDDGTPRTITWGSSFVSSSVTLPPTTTTSTTLTVILQYFTISSYGNNKWVCASYF